MRNSCFGPDCTILGYRSCEYGFVTEASILLHWTENNDWECLEHFIILWKVKRCKTCVSALNALFGGYQSCKYGFVTKATILLHWTQIDDWECSGAFQKPSESKEMQKHLFQALMHYLRVPKLRIWFHNQSIHSTPLDQN
jgi:hypothetical protein